ncbi:MAG: Spo0B domain-containing protein [Paenibacillaceae bacterium]|nr:Spo0B domain-containing protein [Paenibacillaceae bacterium]
MVRKGNSRNETADLRLIRTVNHYRHDWMNDLQVMSGYLQLGKYDELRRFIEKVKEKSCVESNTAKLGDPSLVAYFQSFRAEHHSLTLEIELERELNLAALPLDAERVSGLIRDVTELIHTHAAIAEAEPNTLSIGFDAEETGLLVDFVYTGSYREKLRGELTRYGERAARDLAELHMEWGERTAAVTVRVPFD